MSVFDCVCGLSVFVLVLFRDKAARAISERMAKLKELYDKKLITEEEYNKRKSELLSKI